MSSIVFITNEESAVVATDTLSVSAKTLLPFSFTSKAIIVPHLRMIIAGTGVMGFSTRWFTIVNDRMVVRNIDHLNFHAPDALKKLWADYLEEFSISPNITTTIYHFGFSQENDTIHSYAYRSESDFESELLNHGFYNKPEPGEYEESDNLYELIKNIMVSQREVQTLKPESERLYIGGEIQIVHLTKKGFMITLPYEKFDDCDLVEQQIYNNFQK